jgi:hypothetical protein
MDLSRREFMRSLGIALAALVTTGCWPTCYAPVPTTPTGSSDGAWARLRQTWYSLDLLARDAKDLERGQQTRDRLVADHLAALDELVLAVQVSAAAADDMHLAFQSAAHHVWRSNSPVTCYDVSARPYWMESSADLAKQPEVLAEMAGTSGIDPATVVQARAAIERDMAFLSLSSDQEKSLLEVLRQSAGNTGIYPPLDQLDLDVAPDVAEAARVLVDLLLAKR